MSASLEVFESKICTCRVTLYDGKRSMEVTKRRRLESSFRHRVMGSIACFILTPLDKAQELRNIFRNGRLGLQVAHCACCGMAGED